MSKHNRFYSHEPVFKRPSHPRHDNMVTSPPRDRQAKPAPHLDLWLVTHPTVEDDGRLNPYTTTYLKKSMAIMAAQARAGGNKTTPPWAQLYAQGYRARKLSLS